VIEGLLWYLNRSTGVAALVLLSITTVLGVLALGRRPGRRVPGFVTQAVHRNLALLAVVTVVVHVVTAVADEFVDIRWWHAVVPFTGTYERLWLGVGALALDLLLLVTLSSLLRTRLRHRTWRAVHQSAYLLWLTSILHGIGMGSDMRAGLWTVTVVCAAAVPTALAWRLAGLALGPPRAPGAADQTDDAMTMPIRRIP